MMIKIEACRCAIKNLMDRGSHGYSYWDAENNYFHRISWDAVLKWLDGLEEFYEPGDK